MAVRPGQPYNRPRSVDTVQSTSRESKVVADVIFVVVIIAFFALSALYVTWCDRIIGPDEFAPDVATDDL